VCLTAAAGGPLHGQTTEGVRSSADVRSEAEILRDIEALGPRAERAARHVAAMDTIVAHARRDMRHRLEDHLHPLDVRVGPWRVHTPAARARRARAVAARAWAGFGAYAPALVPPDADLFLAVPAPVGADAVALWALDSPWMAETAVGHAMSRLMRAALPPGLAEWAGGGPLPGSVEAETRRRLYRTLVSSPLIPVARCVEGDDTACLDALALSSGGADPWRRLYTPVQRREIVRRRITEAALGPRRAACLDEADDRACLALLRERLSVPLAAAPLDGLARQDLLTFALELAGPDAHERLSRVATNAAPAEALGVLSGLDIETLAARWRDRVLAARPRPRTEAIPLSAAAGLWILILGAAARRSTRWRDR